MLGRFPELGKRNRPDAERHIRVSFNGHYRIAYLVKPGGDIDVLGVFHERLDIRRYLGR